MDIIPLSSWLKVLCYRKKGRYMYHQIKELLLYHFNIIKFIRKELILGVVSRSSHAICTPERHISIWLKNFYFHVPQNNLNKTQFRLFFILMVKPKGVLNFTWSITSLHSLADQLGHKNSLQLCVTTLGSSWHSLSGRWRPKLFKQKASLVLIPLSQLLEHCSIQMILWNRKHSMRNTGQNRLPVLKMKSIVLDKCSYIKVIDGYCVHFG